MVRHESYAAPHAGQDHPATAKRGRHRHEPPTAVWREHALAEIASREFAAERLRAQATPERPFPADAAARIQRYLNAARMAAVDHGLRRRERLLSSLRGANVERTWGQLDAAEEAIVQVATDDYVIAQLPRVLRRVQRALAPDDPRRLRLEEIARRHAAGSPSATEDEALVTVLTRRLCEVGTSDADQAGLREAIARCEQRNHVSEAEREAVVVALHAANCAGRRGQTRVRSFRNMLYVCAVVLSLAAAGLALLGFLRPDLAPLCFQPSNQVVCPTKVAALKPLGKATGQPSPAETAGQQARQDQLARDTADKLDVLLIEVIGLIAAAVAAAAALREIRGTSTPYGVPLALAVLKLPTGALTAALALLLMRGQFVPGLSALDTPAQIIAWAIVFGYAQQLFTRFVDQRAQTVLDNAGGHDPAATQPSRSEVPAGQPNTLAAEAQ